MQKKKKFDKDSTVLMFQMIINCKNILNTSWL